MPTSPEINPFIKSKIKNELTNRIYPSLLSSIPLLIATASMLVYKLHGHINQLYLNIWLGVFLCAIAGQALLGFQFKKAKDHASLEPIYFKLLITDVATIGLLWGIAGVLFMPADAIGQSYLIFMLAFVAGGGALYLMGSYLAASVYTAGILIPLAGSLMYSFFSETHHEIYYNVTVALVCYLTLLLITSYYCSKYLSKNIVQTLLNKSLTEELSNQGEELEKINLISRKEIEKLFATPPSTYEAPRPSNYKLKRIDALTNTDTPDVMEIKFTYASAYAHRHHESLAVFCINIENFNRVKNILGRDAADLLLKTVAIRLIYCKRETDILTRVDENKFVLIISEVLLGTEINIVLKRILKTFAEKTMINNHKVNIDANIGISVHPKDGEEIHQLIRNAEIAMSNSSSALADHPNVKIYDPEKIKSQASHNL